MSEAGDESEMVPLMLGPGMSWAFAGTVMASSAAAFSLGAGVPAFVATGLGVAMVVLAARAAHVRRSLVSLYFAAQSALAVGILVLGEGRGVLVVMPLVSQLAVVASRRTVVLYATAGAAVFAGAFGPHAASGAMVLGQLAAFLAAALFTIVFTDVALRERRARTESERLAAALEQAQSRIAELAVADERVRLAGEIHDGLGHALTAARMQIEGAAAVLDRDPARAKEALGKASRLVRDGLADVRHSVRALRSDGEEATLEARLRRLVHETPDELDVDLALHGERRALLPSEEHALFRVAQEALTNVGRHARATRVTVTLDCRARETVLEVVDDGRAENEVVFGVGLTGMQERLARFNGSLAVDREHRGGVRVRAVLPARATAGEPR